MRHQKAAALSAPLEFPFLSAHLSLPLSPFRPFIHSGSWRGSCTKVFEQEKGKEKAISLVLRSCLAESTTFLPGSETRARAMEGRAEDGHGFLLASTLLTCLSELLPPSFQPGEQLEGKDFRGEAACGGCQSTPPLAIDSSLYLN